MREKIKYYLQKIAGLFLAKPIISKGKTVGYSLVRSEKSNVHLSDKCKVFPPYYMHNAEVGDYSYISKNCTINNTHIGKFCSIGPNFSSGLGIHPTHGVSTSPMFYSTAKQNGFSLTDKNKVEEHKKIEIGHDVFIGANVTVLDGVIIGNGAVIGAGAVVINDIPPYAIAVGVPAKVVKFRFEESVVNRLVKIEWWDLEDDEVQKVEKYFFDLEGFIDNLTDNC